MGRRILLIHDLQVSNGNFQGHLPWGFEWFRTLINSDHEHDIRILVVDYTDPKMIFTNNGTEFDHHDKYLIHIKDVVENYHTKNNLTPNNVNIFFSDGVLNHFSSNIKNDLKTKLWEKGIFIVDQDEFFLEAVNKGYELFI